MSRRRFAVAVALTLTALTTGAHEVRREPVPADERRDLRALFALAPGVSSTDEYGGKAGPIVVEVIVARIGPDGKMTKVCVRTEEAAIRFFESDAATKQEAQQK